MKLDNVPVYGNVDIARSLLMQGYQMKDIKPNYKNPGQVVYYFEPEAKEALDKILDNFKSK